MNSKLCSFLAFASIGIAVTRADNPVVTPRPIPATRPEMKELLENMKKRPHRIPLPELTEQEQEELGERANNYEARLRSSYIPAAEGSVFGSGRSRTSNSTKQIPEPANAPRIDFTRNADENMTLSYQFKTMLFWIVSRTNNCQYCLGHQEWKLSATGMNDDAIAALDADWSAYTKKEQAAFAFARLLTYEPHRLSDAEVNRVKEFYTDLQVLEMTMSIAGNNAINRWKEGTGIPQSAGNTFTGRRGAVAANGSAEATAAQHADSFTTPTSEKFKAAVSIVAPLDILNGTPSGKGASTRPTMESRDKVIARLAEAASRSARLPLAEKSVAEAWLKESGQDVAAENWMRLIANFPNEGRGRLPSLVSREKQTGELTELQKAQLNWIIARQDRAWYAVGHAKKKLESLGQTDAQIFALDGDWNEFNAADQSLFKFAQHLAASPIALTEEDAAQALQKTSPRLVVQAINHVASCAYFDRVTEAGGLAIDK
jgi:alkylhydroperoxidase family enzyme